MQEGVYKMLVRDTSYTISGVHVSPETLVRRGGIKNYHLTAYSLSDISAKNYQNRLTCVEAIVCNISVVFLRHSVYGVMENGNSCVVCKLPKSCVSPNKNSFLKIGDDTY